MAAGPSTYLTVETVTKRFGGVTALDRVSLGVQQRQVTSIIGSNGAGKTTLLNAISQLDPPDEGRVWLDGRELTGLAPEAVVHQGVARTFQQLRIFQKLSVLDNVLLGFQQNPGESLWRLFGTPHRVRASQRRNHGRAVEILTMVGLLEFARKSAGTLSYGQQKLLSLARVLATDARLLMLDEPTSGLPPDMITLILGVVRGLVGKGRTVLLIEHDMDVVFDVSDWVIVLDEGRLLYEGKPDAVRQNPEVRAIYLGTRVAA